MADSKSEYQPPKQVDKQHLSQIMDIGEKLKKLRKKTDLSISVYAKLKQIKISRNSYTKMEQGEIYFSLRNLMIILDYHGLDLKTFIETDIEDL